MTQPREKWADDDCRPDLDSTAFPDYHLIRVYSHDSNIALKQKPTKEMFEKDLKLVDGAVLCIFKDADTRKEWGSYFVVIHRKVDTELDWKKSPKKYLKVNKLWDPPSDWRGMYVNSSKGAIESSIATVARESWHPYIEIANFFGHAFSEFKKQMPNETLAIDNYKEALEALKVEAEDNAEEEAEAKAKKSGKKPT
ncbi:MAG: hypothetical protein Q9205_004518 [Flavoplaca limonia]